MTVPSPPDAGRVAAVRAFNRFYTQHLGVLRDGWLDSPFSLTEARVLYEIKQRERATASEIAHDLGLDAGYLSRILRRFHKSGLIRKTVSPHDARQSFLSITARGRKAFEPLDARAERQAGAVLGRLAAPEQQHLVSAMHAIETMIVSGRRARSEITLRQPRPGDLGWVVARHAELISWNTAGRKTSRVCVHRSSPTSPANSTRNANAVGLPRWTGKMSGRFFW
jgi:DNA-binding MarR family transcriptional regulator